MPGSWMHSGWTWRLGVSPRVQTLQSAVDDGRDSCGWSFSASQGSLQGHDPSTGPGLAPQHPNRPTQPNLPRASRPGESQARANFFNDRASDSKPRAAQIHPSSRPSRIHVRSKLQKCDSDCVHQICLGQMPNCQRSQRCGHVQDLFFSRVTCV